MIIIHGEHLVQSREKLNTVVQGLEEKTKVLRLEAKKIDLASIEEAFGSQSLFAEPRTVIIEELHSLPRSKKKTELIQLLATAADAEQAPQVILWEKRLLTATMLKQFKTAEVFTFKISKSVFKLVEELQGNLSVQKNSQWGARLPLLHQAMAQEDAFFVFTMLIRQIRMLIQLKDGGRPAGPPFMVNKLRAQAKTFSLEHLLQLHQKLADVDYSLKSSSSPLELSSQLDLFVGAL